MSNDFVPSYSQHERSNTVLSDMSSSSISSPGIGPLSPFISGASDPESDVTSSTSSVASETILKRIRLSDSPSPTSPFDLDDIESTTKVGNALVVTVGRPESCSTPVADLCVPDPLSQLDLPPSAIPLPSSTDEEETSSSDLTATAELPQIDHNIVPPANFALVAEGVYRSSFPKKENFEFLNTLGLKTVL
jgi:hypothetical protein